MRFVRFVGWTLIGAELEAPERRIVARLAMPLDAARTLWADLADALREEGGYGDRRAPRSQRRNSVTGARTTERLTNASVR